MAPNMNPLIFLLLLLILPSTLNAVGTPKRNQQLTSTPRQQRLRQMLDNSSNSSSTNTTFIKYHWEEEWYEGMPIDHFAYADPRKFKLRYLINAKNFLHENAPIFFGVGGEQNVEDLANGWGLLWDLAEEFGAAIVFAEHRYYGETHPFGNETFSRAANLGYLSSEQALADFALLIGHLKEHRLPNATKSPVIAFGGSYPGRLTAWMRVKYPHVIDGGIASSAPVLQYRNGRPGVEHSYYEIVTRAFNHGGCSLQSLTDSFDAIRHLANTSEGREFVNKNFHLDPEEDAHLSGPEDGDWLISWIEGAMETMAKLNYPFEAYDLPAWPVKEACKPFASAHTVEELAMASYNILNIYYNYTGTQKTLCLGGQNCTTDTNTLDSDGLAYNWQTCTEREMPFCSRGPTYDPFDTIYDDLCPYNYTNALASCISQFGPIGYNESFFRPDWNIENFGADFPTATNLILSNGWLDPWSGGGWRLNNTQEGSLVSIIIKEGAHQYDLCGESKNDTEEIKEVRRVEKMQIHQWINEAQKRHQQNGKKNITTILG